MKYYKAFIVCGGTTKRKQYNRTIFVQTKSADPISYVLGIIRKISFGRFISIDKINKEDYIAGVSGNNS